MTIPLQIIHISLVTCSVNCFIVKLTFFIGNMHLNSRILKIIGGPRFKTKIKVHQSYVKNMRNSKKVGLGGCYQHFSFTIVIFRTINRKYKELVHSFIYSDPKQWPSCTTMYRDYNFKTDNIIPYEHIYLYYKHLCEKK